MGAGGCGNAPGSAALHQTMPVLQALPHLQGRMRSASEQLWGASSAALGALAPAQGDPATASQIQPNPCAVPSSQREMNKKGEFLFWTWR